MALPRSAAALLPNFIFTRLSVVVLNCPSFNAIVLASHKYNVAALDLPSLNSEALTLPKLTPKTNVLTLTFPSQRCGTYFIHEQHKYVVLRHCFSVPQGFQAKFNTIQVFNPNSTQFRLSTRIKHNLYNHFLSIFTSYIHH